ncbi:trypsin-like peptidase domain-containing protein [Bryobacter aggregatus]|uniref:trypsin-like peptidase domain-containing protein n=1 Tax=Bryobacter aggregatus TaxID=360054 RepID=UPI001EE2A488|nr:trypsin-like peptidase domain-containing protein [Bryobacter aggregatus]
MSEFSAVQSRWQRCGAMDREIIPLQNSDNEIQMRFVHLVVLLALTSAPSLGQTPPAAAPPQELSSFSQSVRALARKVSPCVVEIVVAKYSTGEEEGTKGTGLLRRQRGSGSGVLIDAEGYIITNAHVVSSAYSVKVAPRGGTGEGQAVDAKIVGIDRESDLAVIKIEGKNFPHLAFGRSDLLEQGDIVLAFGSPLGLENSVSMGVVSSPGRTVGEENPIAYIQTDAAINPGNSGGALVNAAGQLVGINSFIMTQSGGNEGIGFAIPSNVVRQAYRQIRAYGGVRRGMIGIAAQNLTPLLAKGLGIEATSGVILSDVAPEGPADKGGMESGDLILTMDGVKVKNLRQVTMEIYRKRKGDQMSFTVLRGKTTVPLNVTVDEEEAHHEKMSGMVSVEKNLVRRLGALLVPLTKDNAQILGPYRHEYGLVVAAKSADGVTQDIDLEVGDVIYGLNGLVTTTVESLREALERLKPGDAMVLQVEREGQVRYVALEWS